MASLVELSLVEPSLDFDIDDVGYESRFGEDFEENEFEETGQMPEPSLETGINIQNYTLVSKLFY